MEDSTKKWFRFVRRLLFGKETPPKLLKLLCWILFSWDVLILVGSLGLMSMFLFIPKVIQKNKGLSDTFGDAGPRFFMTFAILHLVSIVGVLQMWRLRSTGFYLILVSNFTMLAMPYLLLDEKDFSWQLATATAILVGLFASQLKKTR